MKAVQHMIDLRALDMTELDARLKEVRTELFNLRFQAATGQLENHRQIRHVRRQIAQVLTVIQGRRLGFEDVVVANTTGETATARKAQRRAAAAGVAPAKATVPAAAPTESAATAADTDNAETTEEQQ
jgi:large subunit ribosomal protein L29